MGLSKHEAYGFLELPVGADQDSIRTSYKRLALKWHPKKHNNSPDSLKKFQGISRAYKKLSAGYIDDKNMSLEQMLSLYQSVFYPKPYAYNGSGQDSTDDDEDDDEDEMDDNERYLALFSNKLKMKQQKNKAKSGAAGKFESFLTPEERDKNAQELITEEEKEKMRTERRRAKKERRRERKQLEKQLESIPELKKISKGKDAEADKKRKKDKKTAGETSSSGEADFDPNSAFFTKVINKKKKGQSFQDPSQSKKDKLKDKMCSGAKAKDEIELDSIVLRSRQLAIKGNEMAQLGEYTAAIELFSEAVKLDPRDFRFLGNRSYCYDRIQQYDKALRDAEKAIHLAKDWPKGYFRKGRALAALKMYSEAEQAYIQVLKLDKLCEDAVQELLRVRTYQITDMGFSRQQAEAAIKQHGTVQQALDSLLAGVVAENSLVGEVYVSDDEDGFNTAIPTVQHPVNSHISPPQTHHKADKKMDPTNPEGLTALWVGNVLPEVSEKKLSQIFSQYGTVSSVRCLPDKYCAFVNFKNKESAGRGLHALQGSDCLGQRLLIKFPDNPIINESPNVTLRKTTVLFKPPVPPPPVAVVFTEPMEVDKSGIRNLLKQSGPVNGDECYFWRTTGCQFGDQCRNKHIPNHEGVDRKPWQKVK